MLIEFLLSDSGCLLKVIIGQFGIDDRVAVILEIRRLDAAGNRLPSVKKKYGHVAADLFG